MPSRLQSALLFSISLALGACSGSPNDVIHDQLAGTVSHYRCITSERQAKRCYYLAAPRQGARALVVMGEPSFRPVFDDGKRYGFARPATAQGVVVLYPEGGLSQPSYGARTADSIFLNAMLKQARQSYSIAPRDTSIVSHGELWAGNVSGWLKGRPGKPVNNTVQVLHAIPHGPSEKAVLVTPDTEADDELPEDAPDGNLPINTLPEH